MTLEPMEQLKEELGEEESQGVRVMMERQRTSAGRGILKKGGNQEKSTLLAARFLKDLLLWFKPLSSTCPNSG